MKEACQNALFYDALSMADAAVNGGEQLISVDGLYLHWRQWMHYLCI